MHAGSFKAGADAGAGLAANLPGATGAGRFAPSTSGPPHPGTLASALLVWLDARQRGARALLRFEDLDPVRAHTTYAEAIGHSLTHMGLVFDAVSYQSHHVAAHAAALDSLADLGLLYLCTCRRQDIVRRCRDGQQQPQAVDAPSYDNYCRLGTVLNRRNWRTCPGAVRVRLPTGRVVPIDAGPCDLQQSPAAAMGDPIVRRSDYSVAYVLASIVDDAHSGVSHIVRGWDLAILSATQVALMQLLAWPVPTYRHHPMLLDASGRKWSKSKLAADRRATALIQGRGAEVVGHLACALGLAPDAAPITPARLLTQFSWDKIVRGDVFCAAL